jgi:hypothetical protein
VLDEAATIEVKSVVENFLTTSRISGAIVSVNPDPPSSASFGEPVTVSVQVPLSEVSWLLTPMFLTNTNLSGSTVMRRETVQ